MATGLALRQKITIPRHVAKFSKTWNAHLNNNALFSLILKMTNTNNNDNAARAYNDNYDK